MFRNFVTRQRSDSLLRFLVAQQNIQTMLQKTLTWRSKKTVMVLRIRYRKLTVTVEQPLCSSFSDRKADQLSVCPLIIRAFYKTFRFLLKR